jgi:hypothetical protein
MTSVPLLSQQGPSNYNNLSFNQSVVGASQLKTRAKRTMCAAKVLNCLCLPISVPCCSFRWTCQQLMRSNSYHTNQDGTEYCVDTACRSPCWLPKTQHPNRVLPKTNWDVFEETCCDPCGCCIPCNEEIPTRDYLPENLRLRYAELLKTVEISRIIGPLQQSMDDPLLEPNAIDIVNLDLRAVMLATTIRQRQHKTLPISTGPIPLILGFAGPAAEPKREIAIYHEVVPLQLQFD